MKEYHSSVFFLEKLRKCKWCFRGTNSYM